MAVNEIFRQQIVAAKSKKAFDGRAAVAAALILIIITFAGFGPVYYFVPGKAFPPSVDDTRPRLVMTLWIALFAAQVYLVRAKNVKMHMRLGLAGVGLAVLIIVTA